jgi:hypothetical protein
MGLSCAWHRLPPVYSDHRHQIVHRAIDLEGAADQLEAHAVAERLREEGAEARRARL